MGDADGGGKRVELERRGCRAGRTHVSGLPGCAGKPRSRRRVYAIRSGRVYVLQYSLVLMNLRVASCVTLQYKVWCLKNSQAIFGRRFLIFLLIATYILSCEGGRGRCRWRRQA